MEPQENYVCYENIKQEKCPKVKCLGIVTILLLTAFAVTIGLIIGAALASTFLENIGAMIVLAIVFGILFIIAGILLLCNRKKDKKCNHKCCC